jgi:hypothetical protein
VQFKSQIHASLAVFRALIFGVEEVHAVAKRARTRAAAFAVAIAVSNVAFSQSGSDCASSPNAVWSAAQLAAARNDNAALIATFSGALRARWTATLAVGTDLMISFSSFGDGINSKQSTDVEAKLNAELSAILKKHNVPSIAEIGVPIATRIESAEVLRPFERANHASLVRDIEKLHAKIEAAKKRSGSAQSRSSMRMKIDFDAAIALDPTTLENAKGVAGNTSVSFKRIDECWFIDTLDRDKAKSVSTFDARQKSHK